MKAKISQMIGQYISVTIDADGALKLLELLREKLNKGGEDLEDAKRMIKNFDAFYDFMRKKFKEYLTPKKNVSDLIKGTVLVDKIKLIKEGDQKLVTIVFDRNIPREPVEEALRELGYEIAYE